MNEPTIQQLFDLTGKVALVTGGTGHLGSSISRALAEAYRCTSLVYQTVEKVGQASCLPNSPNTIPHFSDKLQAGSLPHFRVQVSKISYSTG